MPATVTPQFSNSGVSTPLRSSVLPRRRGSDGPKKEIWSSMLDGARGGKKMPEKNLIVLGGTTSSQKEFLDTLSSESGKRRPPDRKKRPPPIANRFALGYSYIDVLDEDQDDTLARLSLHLLPSPIPALTPLLRPLLNKKTIPHTLIVILLDWSEPWLWLRQLLEWMRVLRSLITSLDNDTKEALEANITPMTSRTSAALDGITTGTGVDDIRLPTGPGEFDEPLGVPLAVVAQNATHIAAHEKALNWGDAQFDFILQYIRTILLKHGASLIYTMPPSPTDTGSALQMLIHETLGLEDLLGKGKVKYELNDRDRVLIPPGWDSWGKIRVLRPDFDIERYATQWSVDIDVPANASSPEQSEIVKEYEAQIRPPNGSQAESSGSEAKVEVETAPNQSFLSQQAELLAQLRAEDEKERTNKESRRPAPVALGGASSVEEQIGPVQFNMGGVQLDADSMVKQLQDRETARHVPTSPSDADPFSTPTKGPDNTENEKLAAFFKNLMNRPASATNSPRGKASTSDM